LILVDTAVWIDHLRDGDPYLGSLLDRGLVLGHPWVTAELAMGSIRNRRVSSRFGGELKGVRELVERHELFGAGIGYVDAQLLAATMLSTDAALWTRDRRLHAPAQRLGLAYAPETH
jgi:predicted nucleic acid-binding protein